MNLDGSRFPVGPWCQSAKCKDTPVVWARTDRDRLLVNAIPTPDGTIKLTDTGGREPHARTLTVQERARVVWGSLHLAHFATCPDAARYRKKAKTS